MKFISLDAHKRYSYLACVDPETKFFHEAKIEHERGAIRKGLEPLKPGTIVALEAMGNWYWIADEIEAAGFVPKLVNPRQAKLLMGMTNKTDKLDARGMNRLQQAGVLPTVWIPPKELRDQRELIRCRTSLVRLRTQMKNRVHANLAKYGLSSGEVTDLFGKNGREVLGRLMEDLPTETKLSTSLMVEEIGRLDAVVASLEKRIGEVVQPTKEIKLLTSLPGVGPVLSVVIGLEIGDVSRFPRSANLASYAGTTPRVKSSGGKTRYGRLRNDVNRTLKWAFIEAANCACRIHKRHPYRHTSKLYRRVKEKRGHFVAIGAVARHLAEATYWMLKKGVPYKDPGLKTVSSKEM
jgi:transposase